MMVIQILLSDDEFLSEWDRKVLNLPGNFADLCLQAFTARQEVIDWVKEIIANVSILNVLNLTIDLIAFLN